MVLNALKGAVNPPPAGTSLEVEPEAEWKSNPGEPWQVHASVGLLKPDACTSLFGDVDISITINATLTITPNQTLGNMVLRLVLSSDVSDWDAFRCWAGGLGLTGIYLGPIGGLVTAIIVGEAARLAAGKELVSQKINNFVEVSRDSTSITYEARWPLPALPSPAITGVPLVGPDGLIVPGNLAVISAWHESQFVPQSGTLQGTWASGYSCSKLNWDSGYDVEPILVKDPTFLPGNPKNLYRDNLVTVFPTSHAIPRTQWRLDPSGPSVYSLTKVVALAPVPPGQMGRIFLHTSAGVRRYDLAPAPVPKKPSLRETAEGRINCLKPFITPMTELNWLPDPPPYDLGMPPVMHWLVVISEISQGATLNFHTMRGGREIDEPIQITAPGTGPAAFEFITDRATALEVRHNSELPSANCRVQQRWLMPLQSIELPGPVTALARRGQTLTVHMADELMLLHTRSAEVMRVSAAAARAEHNAYQRATPPTAVMMTRRTGSFSVKTVLGTRLDACPATSGTYEGKAPFSIPLVDGMIAAVWRDRLIVARPWGVHWEGRMHTPGTITGQTG
jgi:hypothetical protein